MLEEYVKLFEVPSRPLAMMNSVSSTNLLQVDVDAKIRDQQPVTGAVADVLTRAGYAGTVSRRQFVQLRQRPRRHSQATASRSAGPGFPDRRLGGPRGAENYFSVRGVTAIWSITGAYGDRWSYWL